MQQSSQGNDEDDENGNRSIEYVDSKRYSYEADNELNLKHDYQQTDEQQTRMQRTKKNRRIKMRSSMNIEYIR